MEMRAQFSPKGMLAEDGSINQEFFKPKTVRTGRQGNLYVARLRDVPSHGLALPPPFDRHGNTCAARHR